MESEIIIYQTENGSTKIEVRIENESVWLNQMQMANLFQVAKQNINYHIGSIFKENELNKDSVVKKILTTAADNKSYHTYYYNLDVIISVGYRVKSHIGTQFRIWATQRLNEYLIKGFTMDDERLKSGGQMNYFDELLNRIRDIRSSEKVFYHKVRDIYTTSIDYDPKADMTQAFFATVQNKLHWAVHQHTAAELIAERASAAKANMGLTNWKSDRIRKSDVTIAKNYLTADELTQLNLLVEQYLAFAEAQANAKRPMYMKDWIKKLNDILTINEREVLLDAGRISKKLADEMAEKEFDLYATQQHRADAANSLKELEQLAGKIVSKRPKKQ
jgi:hypothetical protein